MTELKTLKDLIEMRVFDNGNDCEVVFPDDLKQEAINQIKNHNEVEPMPKLKNFTGGKIKFPKRVNELDFEGEKIEVSDKELIKCMKVLNAWIKWFFDITEDDLKGGKIQHEKENRRKTGRSFSD